MAGFSEGLEPDFSTGRNGDGCDGAVLQRHPEPGLRWQLQSANDEIPDDVSVANDDLVRIMLWKKDNAMSASFV